MATRNPRRRCRNCPETKSGAKAEKQWQDAVYTVSNSLELLGGYTAMDRPGDVLPTLKRLHARLGEIITTCEE